MLASQLEDRMFEAQMRADGMPMDNLDQPQQPQQAQRQLQQVPQQQG
ncbi:MAG: hypothetical protein MZW92_29400 [Comamonadaceae bacterium]|nr:hypothetical protein [Comamonadaceae bacterium]